MAAKRKSALEEIYGSTVGSLGRFTSNISQQASSTINQLSKKFTEEFNQLRQPTPSSPVYKTLDFLSRYQPTGQIKVTSPQEYAKVPLGTMPLVQMPNLRPTLNVMQRDFESLVSRIPNVPAFLPTPKVGTPYYKALDIAAQAQPAARQFVEEAIKLVPRAGIALARSQFPGTPQERLADIGQFAQAAVLPLAARPGTSFFLKPTLGGLAKMIPSQAAVGGIYGLGAGLKEKIEVPSVLEQVKGALPAALQGMVIGAALGPVFSLGNVAMFRLLNKQKAFERLLTSSEIRNIAKKMPVNLRIALNDIANTADDLGSYYTRLKMVPTEPTAVGRALRVKPMVRQVEPTFYTLKTPGVAGEAATAPSGVIPSVPPVRPSVTPPIAEVSISPPTVPPVQVQPPVVTPPVPTEPLAPYIERAPNYVSAKDFALDVFGAKPTDLIGFPEPSRIVPRDIDRVDLGAVADYTGRLEQGLPVEPVRVTIEDGQLVTTEGTHRVLAAQQTGIPVPTIISGAEQILPGFQTISDLYSQATGKTLAEEGIKAVEEEPFVGKQEIPRILGGLFSKDEIEFLGVKEIPTPEGKLAKGKYADSVIEVVEQQGKVSVKTVYHEAFHAYTDKFADKNLKQDAVEEAKAEKGFKTDQEAEEYLADAFADFAGARQTFTGRILSFFTHLWYLIRSLIGKVSRAEQIFQDIVARKRPAVEPQAGFAQSPVFRRYPEGEEPTVPAKVAEEIVEPEEIPEVPVTPPAPIVKQLSPQKLIDDLV